MDFPRKTFLFVAYYISPAIPIVLLLPLVAFMWSYSAFWLDAILMIYLITFSLRAIERLNASADGRAKKRVDKAEEDWDKKFRQ